MTKDPEKWQNLNAFLLGWTKRGGCEKGSTSCGEAKEDEDYVQQGLFVQNSLVLNSLPLTITMSFSFQWIKDIFHGGEGWSVLFCFQKERGEGSAHPFCTCCLEGVALFSLFFKVCVRRYIYVLVIQSCLTLCNAMDPRLLCSWNSPGKNTGVDSHPRLQGIFLTQGSNLGLLHCRQILY